MKKKIALEILYIGEDDDSNHSIRSLSEDFDNYLKLAPLKFWNGGLTAVSSFQI